MPPTTPLGRRPSLRPVLLHAAAAALVAVAVATCSDDKMNGPSHGGRGYFAFRPVTHLSAPPASFGIVIDSVHLRLTLPPSTIVLDTTAYFPADSSNLHLTLAVPLEQQSETLQALIELKAGGVVIFSATQSVEVVSGPPGSSPTPTVNLVFVGPGTSIAHITVLPRDTAIALGDSANYSATAVDSSSNPVTQFYVGWKSSDSTVAKINANGLLRAPTHRGSIKVIGTTPTGIADTTNVTFVPTARILEKSGGDLQTGTVAQAPALPLTVIAKAADSLGVAGVPVRFSVLSGGGTVADSLVLTDTAGHAATPVTLGTAAGPQKFVAQAGTLTPDTFTVTAVAGAPAAIAIHGGNAQTDTVGAPMPAPFTAKVTDAFGNAAAGARVAWVRLAGGGTLANDTTVSDTTGVAAADYTLGATPRTDSVKATLVGTPASVTFTVTGVPPAPAAIAIVSGDAQSDTVTKALALPLVVSVSGSGSRPVAGARVAFSLKSGTGTFGGPAVDTVTTDTLGHVQAPFTLGTLAGTDSIQAKTVLGGFTATFHANATAAAPTVIGVQSGDAQTDTTSTALPNPLVVKVTDAFANPVNGVKVTWTRTGGGTLAADSTFTAATGLTQVGYTLGATPRTDTVAATIAGTGFFARLTAVAVPPAPSGIAVLGGSAQTDTVGKTLAQPFVVQVTGAGARPVAGAQVVFTFRAGTGTIGGKAADTVATDTAGKAQGALTLGTLAGTDSIQAAVLGAGFGPAVIGATAVPAAPSLIAIVAGNAQSDTVGKALPNPLAVKVTDAHGNAVTGARVAWSVHAGGGSFAPSDTSTTNAAGQGSVTFTLPAAAGLDSVRATLVGTSAFVDFTATGTSGAASAITIVSGAAQSDTAGLALPLPLVVRVADGANNPVAGAKVYWTRTAGSGTVSADSNVTDVSGHAQITFTLGTAAGTDSVKANITGGASVVFGMTGTAGAATALAATGGTGQSGTAGAALPLPLTVKATDAHGNAVAGVNVTWAVTQGGGSLAGVTSTTDATGTSTVTTWTLGGTAGTNTATATVSGLTGSPVTFSAVSLPIGTTKTWTGAAGSAWNTAGSWSPSGVPTSTDNVYIPTTATAPSLAANASVGGVSLEAGVTLTIAAGDTLNSLGTILVPATASVTGSGILGLAGSTQQVSGTVANLAITNSAQLAAATQVTGNVTVSGGGSLTVNGKALTVLGNVTLAGSGQLVMTSAADSVDVGGTYTAGGGSSGSTLSAGKLVLRGGFAETSGTADNFSATGTHTTIFAGSSAQGISFAFPGPATSHFQNLTVTNPAGVTLASGIAAAGTVTLTGGAVAGTGRAATIGGGLADPSNARWLVDTTTFLGGGALQLPDSMAGVVAFTGAGVTLSKAFKVNGYLILGGSGTLAPAGHTLTVAGTSPAGSVALSGNAQLVMTNAADSVDVAGVYAAGGGTSTGNLTAGKLVLRGPFTQLATFANDFAPSGTHRVIFAGSASQAVFFNNPGAGGSGFQNVTFANAAGVVLGSNVSVGGTATVASGQVTAPFRAATLVQGLVDAGFGWRADTTVLTGNGAAFPDSMYGSVHLQGADTLTHPFKALGALTVDGSGVLVPNGNLVRVAGAFATAGNGHLVMTNALDSVDVGGSYTAGGATSTGDLLKGTLVLRGGFSQLATFSNDFAAGGTHRTVLAGSAAQSVSFANPGAATSHFQELVVDNPAGVTLASSGAANGTVTLRRGIVTGTGRAFTIGASLSDTSNGSWRPDTTLFTGTADTLPTALQGTVRISGTADLGGPLSVGGALFVEGSGTLRTQGHPLTVGGAMTVSGSAHFQMVNAADSVDVGGLFTDATGGGGTGDLTQGILVLRGGFAQAGGSDAFVPSGSHRTRFAGSTAQTLSFSALPSAFNLVEFADPAGVTATSDFSVTSTATVTSGTVTGVNRGATLGGALVDASGNGWRMDTTTFSATPGALPDSLHGVVHLQSAVTLTKALRVSGTLFLDGGAALTPAGFPLTVTGPLHETAGGHLRMLSPADSVDAGGFVTAATTSGAGLDTAGVLVLRGGFHQLSGGTALAFQPSGSHRTRIVTGSVDSIAFYNPSFTSGSHFNHLEFTAGSGTIVIGSDVEAVGTITKASGAAPTLKGAGSLLRAAGLDVSGLVLDDLRLMKSGTAQIQRFDSVTFQHEDSTADQFTIVEGGSASPQTFTGIVFSNPVVFNTGHYIVAADSAADGKRVTINMNRSTPLYGGSFTSTTLLGGSDSTAVHWSGLAFATAPVNGVTGIPLAPVRVALVGPLGDTLTNVADTVQALIATNPVGGTLTGVTSVPLVNGIATFDSLTLTGVGNGYVLMFGANGFQPITSAALNIDIQIPLGINAVWRGTADSLWTNAANWQGGTLPDSVSNVFIPLGAAHHPYLGVSGFVHVNRLVLDAGATFKADTFATVVVDSSLDNGGTILGGGLVTLAKTGTVRGIFNTLTVTGAFAVAPGSTLLANRDLTVSGVGARLDLNGTSSGTNGNLSVTNGALLVMTHAADSLNVTGDATFNGGNELGSLTAGRILLQGNLAQYASSQVGASPTAFAATAGHVTELLRGSGIQTVHFANPDTLASHLGSLVISGGDSVVFDTLAIALGNVSVTGTNAAVQSHDTLVVAGNVSTASGSRLWLTGLAVAGTLNAAGAYHVGTTGFVGAGQVIPALPYDSIQVLGAAGLGTDVSAARLIVGGALPASRFDLNGHTLTLAGDAFVDTAGTLVMQAAADTLRVGGNLTVQGRDSTGQLTAGLIDLGGNFSQPAGSTAFLPSGSHTVRFNGGTHTWSFYTPGFLQSGFVPSSFEHLVITGGAAVEGLTSAPVGGDLTVTASTLTDTTARYISDVYTPSVVRVAGNVTVDGASTLNLLGLGVGGTLSAPTSPAQYAVVTTFFTGTGQTVPVLPYQGVEVEGDAQAAAALSMSALTVGNGTDPAAFDPAGFPLTVAGQLQVAPGGLLDMTHATDSVDVGGYVSFAGANSNGHLTAGTLVLRSGFVQNGGGNDSAFFATGTHRTVFTAPSGPIIGVSYAGTRFNRLTILGTLGIQDGSQPLVAGDSLRLVQGGLVQSGGAHVTALGYFEVDSFATIDVDTLDLNAGVHVSNAASYNVGRTRFTGAGQTIALQTAPLRNVDVLGTATLGSLTFVGDTLTVKGQLDLGGNRLVVDSLFQTQGTGTLKMTAAADTLITYGGANFDGGSTGGLLTAGVVQTPIFVQDGTNNAASFAASGSHRLEIINNPTGSGERIAFGTPGAAASHPQNMYISGYTTIQLQSNLFVGDTLIYDVSDGVVNGASGTKVTVMGPYVQAAFNNFNVDTLELHDSTAILNPSNSSNWMPHTTVFAGTNQAIRDSIDYLGVNVTGSAHVAYHASATSIVVSGAGNLTVGPGNFGSSGDFTTMEGGILTMTDPGAILFVNGNATFGGASTASSLTAGEIQVGGNFTEQGNSNASDFSPLGTKVTLTGAGPQTVHFAQPSGSSFRDLDVLNSGGVVLQGQVNVLGNLNSNQNITGDTLAVYGTMADTSQAGAPQIALHALILGGPVVTNPEFSYSVDRTHFVATNPVPYLPYNDLVINAPITYVPSGLSVNNLYVAGPGSPLYQGQAPTASLTLAPGTYVYAGGVDVENGNLTLGGGNLNASGNLDVGTGGTLTMNQASDSLEVDGAATFGGSSTAGLLTDGTLILGGSFTQTGNADAFAPSGNHLTEFQAVDLPGTTHVISFSNPTTSGFNHLRDDYADTLTFTNGEMDVHGRLTLTHSPFQPGILVSSLTGNGLVRFGGSDIHAATFTNATAQFQDAEPMVAFDSVAFNSPTDGFTQFVGLGVAGDTLTITNPFFTTIGSGTGIYVQAVNTTGSGTFTVQVANSNVGQSEFNAHTLGNALLTLIQWLLPS